MKRATICPAVLFCILAFFVQAAGFELSADMTAREGDQKQTGKLYVKGSKYRIDMKDGSEYAIIRHDKNKSWVVIPDQKSYIEMPFDPKRRPAIEEGQSSNGNKRLVGSETVDGHATRKYEVTMTDGGKEGTFYQWITVDLDFPIRTTAVNGTWSIEYRNIRAGVPDAVFEIPETYEKIAMPSAMK
jgi:hypothetical protein